MSQLDSLSTSQDGTGYKELSSVEITEEQEQEQEQVQLRDVHQENAQERVEEIVVTSQGGMSGMSRVSLSISKHYATLIPVADEGLVVTAVDFLVTEQKSILLVCGQKDGSVAVRNPTNRDLINTFRSPSSEQVTCLRTYHAAPATSLIIAGCGSRILCWDLISGKERFNVDTPDDVNCIDIMSSSTPENPLIIYGTDSIAATYDMHSSTGYTFGGLGGDQPYRALKTYCWEENEVERQFVYLANGSAVYVYDRVNNVTVATLRGHKDTVRALSVFTPFDDHSEPLLVSAGDDNSAILWDMATLDKVTSFEGHTGPILACSIFQQNDRGSAPYLFTASADKSIIMWSLFNGERIRKLEGKHFDSIISLGVTSAAVDCDIPIVVSCDKVRGALLWDLTTYEKAKKLEGHTGGVNSVCVYSPADEMSSPLVLTGGSDCAILVWDLLSGALSGRLEGHTDQILGIDTYTLPGGQLVAISVSADCSAIVWDVYNCTQLRVLQEHTDRVTCVKAYTSVDGEPHVVTGSDDHTGIIWHVSTGELVRKLVGHKDKITCVAVLSDSDGSGKPSVVTGSDDNTMIVWKLSKGKPKKTIRNRTSKAGSNGVKCLAVFDRQDGVSKPLLINSSGDYIVTVRDWKTGKLIRDIDCGRGHFVESIEVFAPPDLKNPLLITASVDHSAIIWDLETGQQIRKFDGEHKDSLRDIAVYSPAVLNGSASSYVVTVGDDGLGMAWETIFYSHGCMPLQGTVLRSFERDIEEESTSLASWVRMGLLNAKFGTSVWRENTALFSMALEQKRTDFLLEFKDVLKKLIPFVARSKEGDENGRTLLGLAIRKNDQESVRIVLDCWIAKLNKAAPDSVTQRMLHSSYFLPQSDLMLLCEDFPSEFKRFIIGLRLVKAHNCVNEKCKAFNIMSESRSILHGCAAPSHGVGIWDRYKQQTQSTSLIPLMEDDCKPVVSYYLPLKNSTHLEFLQCYVDMCEGDDNVDIFDSEVGIESLRFAWKEYGRSAHLKSMMQYFIFLTCTTISVFSFSQLTEEDSDLGEFVMAWVLQVLVLLCAFFLTYQLIAKMIANGVSTPLKVYEFFVSNIWNPLDLCILLLIITGTLVRCGYQEETDSSRAILAIGSVFLWFKVLYYLRPFPDSGPLVSMILRIGYDIRYFLIILALVLMGFAQGFWILTFPDENSDYGTLDATFINTFYLMLGTGDNSDFEGSASPELGVVLNVAFSLFMLVLMFNLLIALMGDSFNTVKEKGLGQWRLEQAQIILEQQFLLDSADIAGIPSFLYSLKYRSDENNNDGDENELSFKMQQLEKTQKVLASQIADLDAKMLTKFHDVSQDLQKVLVYLESNLATKIANGPVWIYGAKDLNADLINGVYNPTSAIMNKLPVYQKRDNSDIWLLYEKDSVSWALKTTESKSDPAEPAIAMVSNDPSSLPEKIDHIWKKFDPESGSFVDDQRIHTTLFQARCLECSKDIHRHPEGIWKNGWSCSWPLHVGNNKFSSEEPVYGCNTIKSCNWGVCKSCFESFAT